jgi:hypothetical protein
MKAGKVHCTAEPLAYPGKGQGPDESCFSGSSSYFLASHRRLVCRQVAPGHLSLHIVWISSGPAGQEMAIQAGSLAGVRCRAFIVVLFSTSD